MKKLLQLTLMIFALLLTFQVDVDAQYGGKKKKKKKTKTETTDDYFDESGNIASRLWYGGSFSNIALVSNQFASEFGAAVSPMVGYKFTNNLSAGVISKLNYTFFRDNLSLFTVSQLHLSGGAFARYRVIPAIFLHLEAETTSFQIIDQDNSGRAIIDSDGKAVTFRNAQQRVYIGAGYNSGNGIFGYEISLYYNIIDKATNFRSPFDFRIGFNYNF